MLGLMEALAKEMGRTRHHIRAIKPCYIRTGVKEDP